MSHIVIHRDHPLTLDEARQAAETLAVQLAERYDLSHHWQDDTLYFERSGVGGQIELEPGKLRINVRLGFLLATLLPAGLLRLQAAIPGSLQVRGPLPHPGPAIWALGHVWADFRPA